MRGMAVFLGNPGQRYGETRHNAARRLYPFLGLPELRAWKFRAGALWIAHDRVVMVEPACQMNRSGTAVQQLLGFYKLSPDRLLVAHDDTERPLGSAELRKGGGHRGNNGLRDIQQKLGTADFFRLGIGIGRPAYGSLSSYVLGRFAPSELPDLEAGLQQAASLLDEWARGR